MFDLTEQVRESVETIFFDQARSDTSSCKMAEILLPSEQPTDNAMLNLLTEELRDLIESVQFVNVFRETCNQSFSVLYRRIEHLMQDEEQATQQMVVAKFVPKLVRETKKVLNSERPKEYGGPIDNEYVWAVHENLTLNKYCVMIYSHGVVY